jgi:hypothetical protein
VTLGITAGGETSRRSRYGTERVVSDSVAKIEADEGVVAQAVFKQA